MSSLLCPLCKRSVSQEIASQGSSRLCAECRSMIATIMPQNRQAQLGNRTTLATAPPAMAPAVTLPTSAAASAPAAVQSVPERFAAEAMPARQPEPFEMPQAGNFNAPEAPAFPVAARASELSSLPQATSTVGNLALDSSLEPQPFVEARAEASAIEESSFNAAKTAKHVQAPVIDDVPPSWDKTVNEYHPRLMPEEPSKPRLSRQSAFLALLIIAGLAGGFFLFKAFFKPKTESAKNESQAQVQTPAPQAQTPTPPVTEKPSAPPPTTAPQKNEAKPETAPVNNAATAEKPAAKLPDAAPQGQGNLSLQAALLSTPTAANDFVEKLKKAGIPAYVSPAGSKFKILIGKFATDADARRYMATAREHAKTVGVDLQDLFVNKD